LLVRLFVAKGKLGNGNPCGEALTERGIPKTPTVSRPLKLEVMASRDTEFLYVYIWMNKPEPRAVVPNDTRSSQVTTMEGWKVAVGMYALIAATVNAIYTTHYIMYSPFCLKENQTNP